MAEDLYELYAGLLDQQVNLAEEAVIDVVRASFGNFSSEFKRHLQSLVPPRCGPPATSGASSSSQQLTRVQEEIEAACDSTRRQIATALANGFGALAVLPSALGFSANQPSVPSISGLPTHAAVGANASNNNADNSDNDSMSFKSEDTSECESDCESHSVDEIEMKEEAIDESADTANGNQNNDNVSIKTEIESECDSSDSENSDEEEELAVGREIKEEIDDANPNDQIMVNSFDENSEMQVMEEEHQVENELQSNDNTNSSNFETAHSQMINLNETNSEQQSDGMVIDEDEASNEEDDDEPIIIVVNYEEFETQSIGSPNNQNTVAEGSSNEESTNIAEPDGEFVESADSNENANDHLPVVMLMETNSEQDQAGPPIVSNTASALTRRSARTSASTTVNYAEGMENSLVNQQDTSTGTRKCKRKTGRSGKSNAPKRSRVDPNPTVSAVETDNSEDEEEVIDDPEPETISLGVIVRRLNCSVPGCKKAFPSKVQLVGHLLVKHAIEKYACKVKDCTESYATWTELTTHRNSAHHNLDNDWPCGQCEVTFNTYQDLYHHTSQYHEYGLFVCSADKCDFTEKTRIKVNNHQHKHRPAKHRCTYAGCSSSFYMKSHLTDHFRVHSKEKPFLCSQCPKAFAHKNTLTRHERVHSGLKPYSCTWPHCDYSACGHSDVIGHVRGVHFGLPKSKKKQSELRIIDNRDARLFVKKSTTTGN